MINTTRLRRRITRYSTENGGGKRQSCYTEIETGSGVCVNTIKRFQNGAELREFTLARIDKYLGDRGY